MSKGTIITGLDVETTGLDWNKGHRIIEVSMQVYRLEDRQKLINFTQRINNGGKTIDRKAAAVHGITAADLIGKPGFRDVAPKMKAILERSAAVVTHNGEWFDLPFMAHEFAQAKVDFPMHLHSFDTMQNGMWASYDDKMPSLRELCWTMGVDYDETQAHAAEYDVDVMMAAFFRAADRDLFNLTPILQRKDAA